MSPRAQYYVVRPGPVTTLPSGGRSQAPARLVPLVAVDQLPEWINIVGVPRELKPEDAVQMLAIASDDNSIKVKVEDDGGHDIDNVFEVRIVSRKNKATPAQSTSPKVKVEKVDMKVRLVSPTLSPKDKREDKGADKTEAAATEAKDGREAPGAFVTAPSTPDGVTIVAPTTTSPTMLALGQQLLAAQEYLPKDKSANDGAPFDNVYDLLIALDQKPLSQHFLNTGAATKAKPTVNSNGHGNGDTDIDTDMLVNDLINFGLTDSHSQQGITQLDGPADEEKPVKKEKEEKEKKVNAAAFGDHKGQKEREKKETTSPKTGTPPKKTVVKLAWSPQKPRNSNPVRPCRHWCRTGHW